MFLLEFLTSLMKATSQNMFVCIWHMLRKFDLFTQDLKNRTVNHKILIIYANQTLRCCHWQCSVSYMTSISKAFSSTWKYHVMMVLSNITVIHNIITDNHYNILKTKIALRHTGILLTLHFVQKHISLLLSRYNTLHSIYTHKIKVDFVGAHLLFDSRRQPNMMMGVFNFIYRNWHVKHVELGIMPPTPVISRQPALPFEPHPPLHTGNNGGGSRVKAPSLMSFKVQPRSSREVAQLSLSYYRICWRADASSLHV